MWGSKQSSKRNRLWDKSLGKTELPTANGTNGTKRRPCWFRVPLCIVENPFVVTLTTVLTIYALIGADMKQIFFNKPADIVFDALTYMCMVVFTIEIVLTALGKRDYFGGFFFVLDVASTITLLMDLSWVTENKSKSEDSAMGDNGSKTARLASKAGRIVRVIRLMRILKLYKTIMAARERRLKEQQRTQSAGPGDDAWEYFHEDGHMDEEANESRVGQELVDLTTRRVIVLILLMMLLLPLLQIDSGDRFLNSARFGADAVHEAFKQMEQNNGTLAFKTMYENQMLQYVYYHNWFNTPLNQCPNKAPCSKDYLSQLFWIGIMSTNTGTVKSKARAAELRLSTVTFFNQKVLNDNSSWMYNYGTMPQQATLILGSPWDTKCPEGDNYQMGLSFLKEQIPDTVTYTVECPAQLRGNERKVYTPLLNVKAGDEDWHFVFYFDLRPFSRQESANSIYITLFVCAALGTASLCYSSDADRLVLNPVENMISKVEKFSKNPLKALKVADDEFRKEVQMNDERTNRKSSKCQCLYRKITCKGMESAAEPMETVVLEKTIIKLGSLLALGFGQAGENIIVQNMREVNSATVNVMVEGTRVECVIGATRIRHFSVATEVLQTNVMAFVNQIAEIVHGVVDEFHGAANKSSGDLFLVVWRIAEEKPVCKMADMSIVALTKILGAVHRSPVLVAYRRHPGLQQRLGKNCRVDLTSGLHYGWAIEGAVGSEFKIDASYLSPNVSITESVERATQIYDVNILVAESVIRVCTPDVGAKCRLIDRVIMTGSKDPMELYVIDLDYMSLMVEPPPLSQVQLTSRHKFKVRQFLDLERAKKLSAEVEIGKLFNENPDIAAMRSRYTLEFTHVFNMGYQNYIQGEWQVAQRLLSRTQTMLGVDDGPSKALLRYMETPYHFTAPATWDGIRLLDHSSLA